MTETIPDQLESCRYDVCVQKQLKFGMIKGVSFFTLSGLPPSPFRERGYKKNQMRAHEFLLKRHFNSKYEEIEKKKKIKSILSFNTVLRK
jgi:hypothetical protein